MDSDPNRNISCTDLSGKLGSIPAPRETDPTTAVTHPGEGPSSAMVTRSRARGSRGMSVEPEVEFRPEVEILAETCEGGLGAARLTTDIASQYRTADKPVVTASYTGQEVTSSLSTIHTPNLPAHTYKHGVLGGCQAGRQCLLRSVQRQLRVQKRSRGDLHEQQEVRRDCSAMQRLPGQRQTSGDESTFRGLQKRRGFPSARRLRPLSPFHLGVWDPLPQLGGYGRQGDGAQRVRGDRLEHSEAAEIRLQSRGAGVVLGDQPQTRAEGQHC